MLAGLQKVETTGHGGKRIDAFQLVVRPDARGDYTVVLEAPPVWMADEKHFLATRPG